MTVAVATPGVSGFSIKPVYDATGIALWHWRAWHGDAVEGNAAESYEAACEAVKESHTRLSEGVG